MWPLIHKIWHHDPEHNDIQHSDVQLIYTQQNGLTLGIYDTRYIHTHHNIHLGWSTVN